MSEELEARHIVNDGESISIVKLPGRDVLRDMDLCGRWVCDCRECVTHDVQQHGRDAARTKCEADRGMSTGAAASSSPTTSTARRQANLQYTNLLFRQSIYRPCTSKHIKKRKLRKPLLTIDPKIKNFTKQITTKYLQKFKRCISIQNPNAKRNLFKTNRKINQLSSLMVKYPRRMKKYNLGGTGARLGLVNSIKVPVSFSNTTSMVHSRKRQESHYNRTKLIATNLFSKLMYYLKLFFVMKRKSQTTKKSNRKKHTCYEPPAVQQSRVNVATGMSSIPNSSIHSFNDQETQVSEHSASSVDREPLVTSISMCNVYSQCMLMRNNLLIQHRNKNGKMFNKKSRRVMFRGHHNRFMTRTYRQNFNKTYNTFLAEINYTNQPLQPCQNPQGVRIGSTWDVYIDFGRSEVLPRQGGADPGSGIFRFTQGNIGQGSRSKPYQCAPGDCVAGACNSNVCFKRLNKSAPYGSHVSTQSQSKLRDQRAVREKTYGRKKANLSTSKTRKRGDSRLAGNQMALTPAGLPCRQSVRIGSTCSFNVNLYKEMAALGTRSGRNYQGHTTVHREAGRVREKKKSLKTFQCEPGICVPGKCTPSECLKQFECKPKICRPGKCDLSDCYRRQRGTATESSLPGSSNGSSQVSTQSYRLKGRALRAGRETFYKEKGTLSKPNRSKPQLNMPHRRAVRIGSKCSFNVEFYKCSPQNGLVTSQPDYQSMKSLPNKGKPRGMFECEPGVCIPGKCTPSECLKQSEYNPKVCVPCKCDPTDCMQRLRGTFTGTDGSHTGSSISTQSHKLKRGKLRAVDRTLYKEKGVSSVSRNKPTLMRTSNRQAVRIGSNCSFNIQFYKAIFPPLMGDQNYPPVNFNNQDDNGNNRIKQSQISDQSDSSGGRKSGKKNKTLIKYACEPGVCIPGKCNPKECFQLLKAKHSIDNDGSLTDNSVATASQASKKLKSKSKSKRPELSAKNTKFYTERGASSMPRSKTLLHLQNRQAVRIGSTCSFNMEFYKQIPANKRQQPFQYNIDERRKYPAFPSSSETSGGQSTGKKEKTTGKKEISTGKKDRLARLGGGTAVPPDKTKQIKQPAGQHDQGDATLQEESNSLLGGKSKGTKGKKAQEQGDAITKSKLSTGTQGQASTRNRTKRKQSQTRVSDQQSETSVDEKVGTDKLMDPVETPVQRNIHSKKTGMTSNKKTKYDQSDKGCGYELFDRLINRNEDTRTEGSLSTQSKLTGSTSKTTNVNLDRKVEAERRKTEASISPVYKNMGTSGIATNKNIHSYSYSNSLDTPQRIPPLDTPGNAKQVVRIGSSCSFNIKVFKDKPLTPAQVASIRSAYTPPPRPPPGGGFYGSSGLGGPKPELPEKEEENASYLKKWFCRMMGQPDFPECAGFQLHGSQTSQKCQCPARFTSIDAGTTNAYGNLLRPAVQSCCANAATQSRRGPGLHQLSLNDDYLRSALCKCVAQLNPSRGTPGPRNVPYKSIVPGNWPFGPVPGYGDDFNRYKVREKAFVIGSGGGFNVNFFKKRK